MTTNKTRCIITVLCDGNVYVEVNTYVTPWSDLLTEVTWSWDQRWGSRDTMKHLTPEPPTQFRSCFFSLNFSPSAILTDVGNTSGPSWTFTVSRASAHFLRSYILWLEICVSLFAQSRAVTAEAQFLHFHLLVNPASVRKTKKKNLKSWFISNGTKWRYFARGVWLDTSTHAEIIRVEFHCVSGLNQRDADSPHIT